VLSKVKNIESERHKTPGLRIMPARKILSVIYHSLDIDSDLYQAQWIEQFFDLDFANYLDRNMQQFWDDFHKITHAAGELITATQLEKKLFKNLQQSLKMAVCLQPYLDADLQDRTLPWLMKIWKRHVDRLEQSAILAADEKENDKRKKDRIRELDAHKGGQKPEERKGNANPNRRQANASVAPDGNGSRGGGGSSVNSGSGDGPARGTEEFKKKFFCLWNASKYNYGLKCTRTAKECDYGHWLPKNKEEFELAVGNKDWFRDKMEEAKLKMKAGTFERSNPGTKPPVHDKSKGKGKGGGRDRSGSADRNKDKDKKGKGGRGSRNSSPAGRDRGPANPNYRASGKAALAYYKSTANCDECTAANICKLGDECDDEACKGKRCHFTKSVATEILGAASKVRKAAGAVSTTGSSSGSGSDSGSGSGSDAADKPNKKRNKKNKKDK
jgi:uncharacterized membrane protein YgcG